MCNIIIKSIALGIVLVLIMFYVDAWLNGSDQAFNNFYVLPKQY